MTEQLHRLALAGRLLRLRLQRLLLRIGIKEDQFLVLIAFVIGAATGLFTHGFYFLIEYATVLAFGEGEHLGLFAGQWWMLLILPTVGGLAVGYITHAFARESKGHGVPQVMDALFRRGGEIRGRVASVTAVTSAMTIGSGGSAGAEGPIIQIGAAIGSSLGRTLKVPRRQMSVVVACGIAGGIAAIFNAPVAGVLFALEIFLYEFSFRTFTPIVISSVISCSIMHALRLGEVAIFEVEVLRALEYVFSLRQLPLFLVLGILCALAAVAFTRVLYLIEDLAEHVQLPEPLKPAVGAAGVGIIGVTYFLAQSSIEMPPFFGNGYPVIQAMLGPDVFQMTVTGLVLLFLLKLVATSLTLGSGGSGGVFAPSLLMGATLGGAYAMALHTLGIIPITSVSAYALVGMAAMVGATMHAPLTAIVMLYEITREPRVVLPVMFAAIIATSGARFLCRDSIYTLKLRREGVRIGPVTDLTILRRITVSDVEWLEPPRVKTDEPFHRLLELAGKTDAVDFVVVDEDNAYQGMVTGQDVRTALLEPEAVSLLVVGELLRSEIPPVSPHETLDLVLDKFARNDVFSLPVASAEDRTTIIGLLTRQTAMRRYQEELDRQA